MRFVTIKHPKGANEARVPESSVPTWEALGWTTVPTEAPATGPEVPSPAPEESVTPIEVAEVVDLTENDPDQEA